MQASIESGLAFLGSNTFQISKYAGTFTAYGDDRFKNRRDISYESYRDFAKLVQNVAQLTCPKVLEDGAQAFYGKLQTNPNLTLCGTDAGFIEVDNFHIDEGRNLSSEDVEFSRRVCAIGHQIVQRLFPKGGAVGRMMRINGRNYEIVGALAEKGQAFGLDEDNVVIVPITTFCEDYGSRNRSINIAVKAKNQIVYQPTEGAAIGAFRRVRRLRPEEASDFEVYGNDSLSGAFRQIAGVIRLGALVISTFALISAGVGIMNIMLANVTERTKEIGIRKSLGARRSHVRIQFIIEALFLSLMGAVSGILLGILAGNGLAVWLKANVVFPWEWALIGVAACSGIGIGFGIYPAQKAAALDPIEAVRHD
jgi:putative ABC transport system permease protein